MSWLRKLRMTHCARTAHTSSVSEYPMTYEQAILEIAKRIQPTTKSQVVALEDADGLAVAESVIASEPNPRFDNSAVDGYAIGSSEDGMEDVRLILAGSIAAGGIEQKSIQQGTALRILTGAPVPEGTYGIIMQEDVEVEGSLVLIKESIRPSAHIRRQGADFTKGAILFPSGSVFHPGSAAICAFAGHTSVKVWCAPTVSVITTGDELVEPSEQPIGSQIRDTNSVMLSRQVFSATHSNVICSRVKDSEEELVQSLTAAAQTSEVILVAGGASVGDRDFLAPAMARLGKTYFHGVGIRPGKPILFGKIDNSFVFGLPGNPASAFVCFEIFVRPALRLLAGWSDWKLQWLRLPSTFPHYAVGREDFVRVNIEDSQLTLSTEQASFGLRSIATAQALAHFPAHQDTAIGRQIPVILL